MGVVATVAAVTVAAVAAAAAVTDPERAVVVA